MEPNWNLSEGLEQNSHKFDHEFFKRYSLREHSEPIKLNKNLAKNYVFQPFIVMCLVLLESFFVTMMQLKAS